MIDYSIILQGVKVNRKLAWLYALSSLHTKVFGQIDLQLNMHGLVFPEFLLMQQLFDAPNHCMKRIDLAARLGMNAPKIMRTLAPMEKIGLVQNEKNPHNASGTLVTLTKAGCRVFEETLETVEQSANRLLDPLGRHEIEAFLTLVDEIH